MYTHIHMYACPPLPPSCPPGGAAVWQRRRRGCVRPYLHGRGAAGWRAVHLGHRARGAAGAGRGGQQHAGEHALWSGRAVCSVLYPGHCATFATRASIQPPLALRPCPLTCLSSAGPPACCPCSSCPCSCRPCPWLCPCSSPIPPTTLTAVLATRVPLSTTHPPLSDPSPPHTLPISEPSHSFPRSGPPECPYSAPQAPPFGLISSAADPIT